MRWHFVMGLMLCGWYGSVAAVEAPGASVSQAAWNVHSASGAYRGTGDGDPTGRTGANVRLSAPPGVAAKQFGTASFALDAGALRGRRLRVTAQLAVADAPNGALLWIRADGPDKKMLGLANTQQDPVAGERRTAQRELLFDVPRGAQRLVFGVLLSGSGELTASGVRLIDEGASASARAVLDAAMDAMKTQALHRDRIDWPNIEADLRARLAPDSTSADAYPLLRELIAKLGDGHSFLMPPQAAQTTREQGRVRYEPKVELVGADIGYVRMPGYVGGGREQHRDFARSIGERIAAIAPRAGGGWIVDLRDNSGGSMWPMLAGLYPLLGPAVLGGDVAPGAALRPWNLAGAMGQSLSPPLPDLSRVPVAVLIGPHTSSSGEAVAIAFSGRADTRSFGQPSDGRSTSNRSIELPDGGMLLLTVARFADRNGKVFGDKIVPDVAVGDENSAAALDAARDWLKQREAAAH
ncbi:S41 family peptidase [Lysobacter sp. CA199]|uniref:S41 family peptidase n=1 Tax=Lysobacter sp. CA199 TaxID=3455608 RepID=UPI003F8D79A4